jgi:excisionase family DNA binding protein
MRTKLVNAKTIADEYQKPKSTIQRWARKGLIPCIRMGWRTLLFDPEAVHRALLKKTVPEQE